MPEVEFAFDFVFFFVFCCRKLMHSPHAPVVWIYAQRCNHCPSPAVQTTAGWLQCVVLSDRLSGQQLLQRAAQWGIRGMGEPTGYGPLR